MSIPTNQKLYDKVKRGIYKKYPKHSAYRSGLLVKEYKKQFKLKFPFREPYKGTKPLKKGLSRWFKEDWKSDTGKYFYSSQSSVYRPTRRITKKTPKTFSELTKKQLKTAKQKKYKKGRVDKF